MDASAVPEASQRRPTAVVFGGSGFIGFHLSRELVRRGYEVVICDLIAPRETSRYVRYVACDVRQEIELQFPSVELVVNLAAVHRTPGHDDFEYYETNVRGAIFVCKWADCAGVKQLVFTSSISVYGPTEELITEQSPVRPTSSYGRSKLIAEALHQNWAGQDAERRLLIVRPAVIFGTHEQGNFTRLARALERRRFIYPGRKDTIKSCGYVKDLIDAVFFAIGKKDLPLFNFAYPARYTIEEICETFQGVSGYKRPKAVPAVVVGLVIRALPQGEWARQRGFHAERIQKLLASTNIYPEALEDAGFIWGTDLEKALSDWRADSNGSLEYL